MAHDNTLSRTLHDVGLAAWFGGSLMGAIGVNGAAAAIGGRDGARVAERGWSRWAPLQFAAVGAYAVGSLGITLGNRGRLRHQPGVASLAAAKTLVSVAAVGATAYAAYLGQQTADDPVPPVAPEDAAEAVDDPAVDEVRQRLGLLQWAVPVLTGALVVMSARMGEQQRAWNVAHGLLERLPDLPSRSALPSLPDLPSIPDLPSRSSLPSRSDLPSRPSLPSLPSLR